LMELDGCFTGWDQNGGNCHITMPERPTRARPGWYTSASLL